LGNLQTTPDSGCAEATSCAGVAPKRKRWDTWLFAPSRRASGTGMSDTPHSQRQCWLTQPLPGCLEPQSLIPARLQLMYRVTPPPADVPRHSATNTSVRAPQARRKSEPAERQVTVYFRKRPLTGTSRTVLHLTLGPAPAPVSADTSGAAGRYSVQRSAAPRHFNKVGDF
jgi:hypothetical protein